MNKIKIALIIIGLALLSGCSSFGRSPLEQAVDEGCVIKKYEVNRSRTIITCQEK